MKLFEFEKYFPTEEICRAKFREVRDKEGIVCSKCGCVHHTWLPSKGQYRCKRGTGSQAKTKVLIMAESTPAFPTKQSQKPKQVGHIKMVVIPNLKAATIDGEAVNAISSESSIASDATSSHKNFVNKL